MRTSSPSSRREREDSKGTSPERRRVFRRKVCKFCSERVEWIDYKDTMRLAKFTSERGKILPRRVSGTCAHHQRELSRALKRARSIALMPFVASS